MDKIEKELFKLSGKERGQIKKILIKLNAGDFVGLDVKKLKGRESIFRVRKGNFRIIYRLQGKDIFILIIQRRHKDTYKF